MNGWLSTDALSNAPEDCGISRNHLERWENNAISEAGGKVLETPNRPDHNRTCTRGATMPFGNQYSDSACADNPPKCDSPTTGGPMPRKAVRA